MPAWSDVYVNFVLREVQNILILLSSPYGAHHRKKWCAPYMTQCGRYMNLLHRCNFGSRHKTAVNKTKTLCIYSKICENFVNVQNMRMLEYRCESISRKPSVSKQFALYHCVVRHKMWCSEYLTLMAQKHFLHTTKLYCTTFL